MDVTAAWNAPIVRIVPDSPVSVDHATEVSTPVGEGVLRRLGEATDAHQLVVDGQERTLHRALLGPSHMLPAALGQKAVVAAADQLGAVLQDNPVSGLDRGPVCKHRCQRVPVVVATLHRAVDLVANPHVCQWLCPAVCHQNRRLPLGTIDTAMLTSPVWVYRPLEGHAG